jgi:hypothetical protein
VIAAAFGLFLLAAPNESGSTIVLSEGKVRVQGYRRPARIVATLVAAQRVKHMTLDAHVGRLVVTVALEGKQPRVTNISDLIGRPEMEFIDGSFDVVFADYNHDGQLDFNLGQECGSNNFCYWLFSIDRSGQVKLLPLPGSASNPGFLWIQGDDAYSTRSIELTNDGIAGSGYDPLTGGFRVRYRWNQKSQGFEVVERTNGRELAGKQQEAP